MPNRSDSVALTSMMGEPIETDASETFMSTAGGPADGTKSDLDC